MKTSSHYLVNAEINPVTEVFLLLISILYTLGTVYISVKLDPNTSENSLIEVTQAGFVLISSVFCIYKIKPGHDLNKFLVLLSLFFIVIFIREMDHHIELFLPHGSWKYPVLAIILGCLYYFYLNTREVYHQLQKFTQEQSFSIAVIGFFMVFVFSRLSGIQEFWSAFMNDSYNRDVKNLVEEGLELLGYSFMLISVTLLRNNRS